MTSETNELGGSPGATARVPQTSLRGRAVRATIWTIVGIAGSNVLRLGGNLILTRLLFPEAFGLMALVFVFLQGMQLLSDFGIGPSVMQNERSSDPRFLNTAWTLQVGRGALIWFVSLVVAGPVARFYQEPMLLYLLPVVGLTGAIDGFASTAKFTVGRLLTIGRLTVFELVAQAASIITMVIWALIDRSVWALVAGAIVAAIVRTALSYRLTDEPRNHFEWDPAAARSIIHFGKWIFLTSAVGFLASHVDRLILGKLIPLDIFGVYTIAFMLASFPDMLVGQMAMKVIFPAATERMRLPRAELRQLIVKNRRPLILALAIGVAFLAAAGDQLVRLLYDPRYYAAGWMLSILALGLWPKMMINSVGAALLAIGQPRYLAVAGIARFVLLVVGLPVAYHAFGMLGVVAAIALSGVSDYFVEGYGLWRHGLLVLRQDLAMTLVWLLTLAGALSLRHVLGLPLPFLPAT